MATDASNTHGPVPVLWLYGPPAVGKSTLGWELFTTLAGSPGAIAYLDLDQVGMCYAAPTDESWAPEPESDYGRHRLQARVLNALLPNFAAAGAAGVVVSGVVDPDRGPDVVLLSGAALTLCRLRVAPEELRRRIAGRARPDDDPDHILRHARSLDRLGGTYVDTTGSSVTEALRRVQAQAPGWPGPLTEARTGARDPSRRPIESGVRHHPADARADRVLWVCGPVAVGKSTVGWQLYERSSRAGIRTAFVDLQQIRFSRPAPGDDPDNHRLASRNLAAAWEAYRATGTSCLIVVGSVDSAETLQTYRDALPTATVTVCRLRASRARIVERVAQRGQGLGPPIAGDAIVGQPDRVLAGIADRSVRQAAELERRALGDLSIDTDHRTPAEVAAEILHRTGWPEVVGRRWASG